MSRQQNRKTADETNGTIAGSDTSLERVSKTKRSLLKAGWVVPVIAAVSLPASGMVHSSCNVYDESC